MEATEANNHGDLQSTETPKRRERRRRKGQGDGKQASIVVVVPPPSGRWTRSQVASEWTDKEAIVLVNEIAAVEQDCLKVLSSHQKWKIIVENCTSMDVVRTLNQCRGKWNSLLAEYNQIKQWESKSKFNNHHSFWGMEAQRRKEVGLPESFDGELFRTIDEHVRSQKDYMDTDPDSDPEAEADLLEVIAKLGSKRHRRRSVPLKAYAGEEPQEIQVEELACFAQEAPSIIHEEEQHQESQVEEEPKKNSEKEKPLANLADEEPQESYVEEDSKKCCREDNLHEVHVEGSSQRSHVEEKPKVTETRKRKTRSTEERIVVENLYRKAEMIHAIVQGNVPKTSHSGAADLKDAEEYNTTFARRQGDKLIACLREVVDILNQFPHLVQACD